MLFKLKFCLQTRYGYLERDSQQLSIANVSIIKQIEKWTIENSMKLKIENQMLQPSYYSSPGTIRA